MNSDLLVLAPPPQKPIGAGSQSEWTALEEEFDLIFPNDYRELITAYGSGRFADFFGVANPFYIARNDISFKKFVRLRLEGITEAKQLHPQQSVELPVYPEKEGLFPWGYTDNGGTLCWLTNNSESPSEIVFLDHGYARGYYRCHLDITDFIAKWLAGHMRVEALTPPGFFPLKRPVFLKHE